MSGKGNCWDNAPMESFFHTLKTERVHHRFAEGAPLQRFKASGGGDLIEHLDIFHLVRVARGKPHD
jgi:transposase InsO family protein